MEIVASSYWDTVTGWCTIAVDCLVVPGAEPHTVVGELYEHSQGDDCFVSCVQINFKPVNIISYFVTMHFLLDMYNLNL